MRNRPIGKKEIFINSAIADKLEEETIKEDLHQYVHVTKWPLEEFQVKPSLDEGSVLNKSLHLLLKEFEWNSLERHTKALGVSKTEWVKHAIYKLMLEEQLIFLKKNKSK